MAIKNKADNRNTDIFVSLLRKPIANLTTIRQMLETITILAIESSCDDTGAAVLRDGKILANCIAGQEIHKQWGGVVPELASRAHMQNIVPVVHQAIQLSGIAINEIQAVAITAGPGLVGSLLVGTTFAKSLALALNIPIIKVNHIHAHIMSVLINQPQTEFPYLCLLVSGGHTQLVQVNAPLEFEILGETTDDAVGEAFDKCAKILGLPYPGGPLIDQYAKLGKPNTHTFSKPNIPDLNFSYSGFKTSVLYYIQKQLAINPNFISENLYDICASIQTALVDSMIVKVKKALNQTGIKHVAIAGGVAANSGLRNAMNTLAADLKITLSIPDFEYCTDNAGMIAMTAYYQYMNKDFSNQYLVAEPRIL